MSLITAFIHCVKEFSEKNESTPMWYRRRLLVEYIDSMKIVWSQECASSINSYQTGRSNSHCVHFLIISGHSESQMVWNKCAIQTMEIRTLDRMCLSVCVLRKIETKSNTADDVGIERRQNVACDREHPQS